MEGSCIFIIDGNIPALYVKKWETPRQTARKTVGVRADVRIQDNHKYKEAFAYTFCPSHICIHRPTVASEPHIQQWTITQLNISLHIIHSYKFRLRFFFQHYRKILHRHNVRWY